MKRLFILGCLSFVAIANAAVKQPSTNYKPAVQMANPVAAKAVAQPSTYQQPQLIHLNPLVHKNLKGLPAIQDANRKSMIAPSSSQYTNAIMNFAYSPGALYQIYCAPLAVTDIQFEAGESIVSIAAGDTLRWQVSKTYSGTGASQTQHILIKPTDVDLTNTIVVTTSLRTYHLILYSTDKTYMASVQWQYPEDDNSFLTQYQNPTVTSRDQQITQTLNLNQMDFGYQTELVQGPSPSWMPTAVFSDGEKTYIQFPKTMQEAPTLYVGDEGDEIVNYRVVANYYVIDGLMRTAELASGHKNASVVKITRK